MRDEKPKVSVIIPTYNRAHLIGRAVQSVLNQTYQDFEIIVVDDGSMDDTEEVINEFQEQDKRIRYIRYEKNKGAAAARNTGIKASRGEYIAFQDSDDEWFPEKLNESMRIITGHKDIDFIFSYGKIIKNKKIIGDVGKAHWVNNTSKKEVVIKLFMGNFIPTQGVLVKKEKIIKVGGFDESFPSASDHELWLRLIPICNIYFIDKPLFNLYFSDECITINVKKRIRSQIRLFNKNNKILRSYIKSKMKYYLIKHKHLRNIFNTAAWDANNRTNNKVLATFLYVVSFIIFPNVGLFYFIKSSFKR
ncbi:Undecaprenyl-phosphate 4-deoxy-4-formamido-L-arabinose transferase [subsurface metagenome]